VRAWEKSRRGPMEGKAHLLKPKFPAILPISVTNYKWESMPFGGQLQQGKFYG